MNVVIPVIQEQQEDGVSDDNDDFLIKILSVILNHLTDEENSENLEPLINRVMNLDQILCKKHTKMLNGNEMESIIYLCWLKENV
ncbi:hypothetical protein GLOIN_2v1771805 [Rhizophagus irregularis DAOM 181602=DAOM 197198]|nr:hypothetical protein GLOIN_2v1771805 [Rhizophagus irregularis DAOM 181602=DAOM 197198]